MEPKILEHCCYLKYLNSWWEENEKRVKSYARFIAVDGGSVGPMPDDSWLLINFGDHTLVELLDWCVNMCFCKEGARVTVAMPFVSKSTIDYLSHNKFIGKYDILTRDTVSDIHTQIVTVSGGGRFFVLQGNLIQSFCPGKYVTTLGITERYYQSVQPLLNSWVKLYNKISNV